MVHRINYLKRISHKVIFVVVLIMLTTALGFIYWSSLSKGNTPASDTRPEVNDMLTLQGKVTMKLASCGATSLYPDEDTKHYAICDSGEGIRVDNKIISTSSGGPGPGYHVNTDSINLGDTVSVSYVVNEEFGGASLNCRQCSLSIVSRRDSSD